MEKPRASNKGAEAILDMCPGSSISLAYHPLFGPHDDIFLMEIDDKLLLDALHQRVTIRGQPDEDAVLCTHSKTYSAKFVGNSNSVFLIPPSDQPEFLQDPHGNDENVYEEKLVASVIKVAHGSIELHEVSPRIDRLKMLLLENPYSDESRMEDSEDHQTGLYTWEHLLDRIQASEEELRSGLEALSAVEIDGYWRTVDKRYMGIMLNILLQNMTLNDWSMNSLNEDEVVTALESDGFPPVLARHCLQVHGRQNGKSTDSRFWKLDEKKVCVHFAREILREGKKKLDIFMTEWIKKIPEGMQASFELLEGEVLTERMGVETWLRTFSASSLPSTPAERFSILFKERPKWVWKDLEPYIRGLSVPGLSSEGLLLKYTRRSQPTPDVEPIFSAR